MGQTALRQQFLLEHTTCFFLILSKNNVGVKRAQNLSSNEPEKKTHFVGLFFSLRLRRSAPCAPPDVPLTTGSTLCLSTFSFTNATMDDRPPPSSCSGNVGLTHFMMKQLQRSGKNYRNSTITTADNSRNFDEFY